MTPQTPGSGRHICSSRSLALKSTTGRFYLVLFLTLANRVIAAQEPVRPFPTPIASAVQAVNRVPEIERPPAASDVLSYWYGSLYRTPFVLQPGTARPADIPRNSLEFSHHQFWALGSNFADVMLNQSSSAEPASGGGTGATEAYVTLRSNIGLNEVTGTRAFARGPIRNLSLELGTNLETKNSSFAPAERTIYIGPNIQFAVPRGYVNVGFHMRKEWNHEGVLGKSENYDPDFNIEPTWMLPFTIGKLRLAYGGFADYNSQKGKDSFGNPTAPEFLIRNSVGLDVGALVGRARVVDLNGGFWYWHNEYGKPSSDPGAEQMTPIVGLSFHLDGVRAIHRK